MSLCVYLDANNIIIYQLVDLYHQISLTNCTIVFRKYKNLILDTYPLGSVAQR